MSPIKSSAALPKIFLSPASTLIMSNSSGSTEISKSRSSQKRAFAAGSPSIVNTSFVAVASIRFSAETINGCANNVNDDPNNIGCNLCYIRDNKSKKEIRFLMPSRNEGERHGQKAQNQSKRKVRNNA